jgi:cation diffusion facilitator family transporter
VVAALFALGSLSFATRPADPSHPYGHGKVEFLSSGFEGGLIAFAAMVIVYQALEALWAGHRLNSIGDGVILIAAAGVGNALFGWFLVRSGRRIHSPAVEADGLHVLSDFWTSAGVVVGLVLVWLTGWHVIDPLVAVVVGVNLGWMGSRILRRAVGGLLDESDLELLTRLVEAFNRVENPGVIAIHRLRAIRFGGVRAHRCAPGRAAVLDGRGSA